MYEFINGGVAMLAAPALGMFGLAAGIWYGRRSVKDTLESARRSASAAATYWARAENARSYIHAIETPTQQIDVTELRAALATPAERLRERMADLAGQVREAIAPTPAEPDWAEGEMTAAFNRIVDGNEWEQPGQFTGEHTLPGNPSPWVSPIAAGPAPAPSAPPAIVHAPRGPQTPPRWQDGGTPPPQRRAKPALTPRDRDWSLLGPVPRLDVPQFPAPFRMPGQHRRQLPNDPRRMAMLDPDPTREFRVRTV